MQQSPSQEVKNNIKKEMKYSVNLLKQMKDFKSYNKDLMTTLLTKKEYTKQEALNILNKYLNIKK